MDTITAPTPSAPSAPLVLETPPVTPVLPPRGALVTTPPPKHHHRPWVAVGSIVLGALLMGASPAWTAWAVPALVKFPTDVNQTPRYTGTFTQFIDAKTAAPLATPAIVTLAVDRHVEAIASESTGDTVLVRETLSYDVQGLPKATLIHQYVMDRRTSANLQDAKAWAFGPTNTMNRANAYWLALPMGSNATTPVMMWKDEIGTTFQAVPSGTSEVVGGLRLVGYTAAATAIPLTDAYLKALDAITPLPRSLTFDQLKPSLIAAGVPVDAGLAALVKVASPADLQALVALAGAPIPLQYVDSFTGTTFVDPRTGGVIDAQGIVERVSVRPTADALPPLLSVLQRYGSDPTIAAMTAALTGLADKPLPVFEYKYSQDSASTAQVAATAADNGSQMDLVENTIPMVLLVLGGLFVAAGALTLILRSRKLHRA